MGVVVKKSGRSIVDIAEKLCLKAFLAYFYSKSRLGAAFINPLDKDCLFVIL